MTGGMPAAPILWADFARRGQQVCDLEAGG
jgi:hypothetical protein